MSTENRYKVQIESAFEGFWRYNIAVTCGLFDAAGRRTGFAAADSTVAPAGSSLAACPDGVPAKRRFEFEAGDCDRLQMYIYIIPHSLPATPRIAESRPFELSIKVLHGGRVVLNDRRAINQWSGASIEINVGREGAVG